MMPSNPASSTQSDGPQSRPTAVRVTTTPEPPRRQAETRSLSDRFAAKIDRVSDEAGRNSQGGDSVSQRADGPRSNKGDLDSLGGQSGQQKDAEFAQADMGRIMRSSDAKVAGSHAPLPAADKAIVEKMAAQIAESWPSANASSAEIEFPVGWLAQKAHLLRQPDGGMAIRIAGLDPKLNALRAGYAQLALLHGLDRRRLRIASLVFDKPERNYSGRASTIPKTV